MKRWTRDKAREWYASQKWLVGCNYIPSTASNQLEMWQKDTFDEKTIRRELGWAADLGMNTLRVFLHDLVWRDDASGFKERIRIFLEIADSYGIKIMYVFFDDCWLPDPVSGVQEEPVPGYHNSRWVNSPGPAAAADPRQEERLKNYVQDIVRTFADDKRILLWDVYNEPGNIFLPILALPWYRRIPKLCIKYPLFMMGFIPTLPLLEKVFLWVREAQPSQPLTAGLYIPQRKVNRILLSSSDVVSFHLYEGVSVLKRHIRKLKMTDRPLLCTEYLNRNTGCTFEGYLPLFKAEKIGCFNWGLVAGKTQTIYSWQTPMPEGGEPSPWFHDILRSDGSPYDEKEIEVFRSLS